MPDRQSSAPSADRPRGLLLTTALALLLLIGVPATRLDARGLSPAEGALAQAALGRLESDARGADAAPATPALLGLVRGWALIVGTTERPLRLLVVLGILLGALSLSLAALRTAGPWALPAAWLVVACLPWLARPDILQPALLLVPGAAFLLAAAGEHGRAPITRALALAVSATAPWFRPALVVLAAALTLFGLVLPGAPDAVGRTGRGRLVLQGLLIAGGVAWCFLATGGPWVVAPEPAGPDAAPALGAAALLPKTLADGLWIAVLLAALCALRDARLVRLPLLAGATVMIAAALGGWLDLALWTVAPTCLVLPAAVSVAGLPRLWRPVALVGLVGLALLRILTPPATADETPRRVLAEARAAGRTGGRLIATGPWRHAILFYGRRGHDPGFPVLLVPEDAASGGLADDLRQRLGPDIRPDRLPPLLAHGFGSAPAGTILGESPPGCELVRTLTIAPDPDGG